MTNGCISRIRRGKLSKNHSVRSDLMSDLKKLSNADVSDCDIDELVDLRSIDIKRNLPLERRADDFMAQVGNPYLFRVDDVVVKVEFGDGNDFSEILTDVILAG